MRTSYLKYSLILIAGLFIVFGACKSKVKAQETAQTEAPCKVVINFGSRGTGIDYLKYEELTTLLKNKLVKYTEKVKGREGEKEICVPLTELAGKEKTDFIEQLKKFDNKDTFISVSVN